MIWKVFVKFRGDSSDLPEVVPRCIGEIVMLEVVAEIEVEDVPKTNVIVCLLAYDELVVLCDDMDGSWMRTDRAETSHKQEKKCPRTPKDIHEVVSEENESIVQGLVSAECWILHEDGPKRVEKLNDQIEEILVPLVLIG